MSSLKCIHTKYAFAITADAGIECEPCEGRGWLLCDFCKGQKTNVKSETNRIYRRCPSCRAVGKKKKKISDFGLAKWLPDQWLNLTVSQFEGTFGKKKKKKKKKKKNPKIQLFTRYGGAKIK
ncbi:putative non-specific serine/threonine protein kinase [Helianthus annuus]|nr:putative non-specific serine/threonine protein kinase [Helianthus annuus]